MATKVEKINAELAAVMAVINKFADDSGYGAFISQASRHELGVALINALETIRPSTDDPV